MTDAATHIWVLPSWTIKFWRKVSAKEIEYVRKDIAQERIEELEKALTDAKEALEGVPEYHDEGMGCGLEDRNITDRYEAMLFGWEQAMERVYSEQVNHAIEVLTAKEPTRYAGFHKENKI